MANRTLVFASLRIATAVLFRYSHVHDTLACQYMCDASEDCAGYLHIRHGEGLCIGVSWTGVAPVSIFSIMGLLDNAGDQRPVSFWSDRIVCLAKKRTDP